MKGGGSPVHQEGLDDWEATENPENKAFHIVLTHIGRDEWGCATRNEVIEVAQWRNDRQNCVLNPRFLVMRWSDFVERDLLKSSDDALHVLIQAETVRYCNLAV
jgi:hypothetical protein